MALSIRRVQVWCGEISDRPGAAAAKLANLAQSGADLEFIFTRPNPLKPQTSVIFLAPITGPDQIQAARAAQLGPSLDTFMICVEGKNKAGIGYALMSNLAIAGLNLRGISISSINDRFVAYLAFDNLDVLTQAVQLLVEIEN